jgi:hypothetical protein
VCADGIESVILNVVPSVIDDDVCGVALQTLNEFARAGTSGFDPISLVNVVAERVLGYDSSRRAAALGHKEKAERDGHGAGCNRCGAE